MVHSYNIVMIKTTVFWSFFVSKEAYVKSTSEDNNVAYVYDENKKEKLLNEKELGLFKMRCNLFDNGYIAIYL